jgi:hypothetical protein
MIIIFQLQSCTTQSSERNNIIPTGREKQYYDLDLEIKMNSAVI